MGMSVTSEYSINPTSMMMSAKSILPSPHATQPLELTVSLSALGMSDVYAFGAFRPPELSDNYVYFTIDKDYKNPVSVFLIINKTQKYNCVISSSDQEISKELRSKLLVKK